MRLRILAIVVAFLAPFLIAPPGVAAPPVSTKVLDLRYAAHPDFDRVVIDLRGAEPDVRDGRARRFHYEGSGKLVPIRGAAGVWISITGRRARRGRQQPLHRAADRAPRLRHPQGAGAHR